MSYSTKYRMEWASSSGAMQVDIQPDGYTGDVLRLTPAAEPLAIEWGNQNERDLSLPLLESVAFLGFKGDSTGQQVEEVLNAGPFEYRVVARQDSAVIWQGFVTADEWANNPRNQEEKIELEADDGLKLLTELTAEESLSQGAEKNVWDLIRSALSRLHDLPYSVGMEWYPYRDGNQLSANTQPLERLSVPDTYLADQLTERGTLEVDAGKINERLILEDLVERFGMRAFLSDGEWWLRQRTQVGPSTGAYKRWVWDGANGTFLSPSSFNATQTLPPKRRREKPRQGVPRLSSVSSTYEYDRLGNLVGNPGFEDALSQWQQTEPVYDFTDGTTVASDVAVIAHSTSNTGRDPTQSDGSALEISVGVTEKDSGDQADITDLPEATFTGLDVFDAGPRGGIQLDLEFGYPFLPGGNQNAQSGAYVELEVGGKYLKRGNLNARADAPESDTEEGTIPIDDPASAIPEATQDGVVVIPEGATLPVLGTGSASKIDVSAPVRVGDTVIRGETDGDIDRTADIRFWYWTTSQNQLQDENTGDGVSDFPVPVTDLPNMEEQTLRASQRTPAGDPVTGNLAVRLQLFIAPNEFETAVLYDNVSLQILQQGEIVDQTQFVASTGAVGESRSLTHRTGDGPSPQHELGLVLQGKNKPTQDWQVGPYSSGDPRSGQNLEELSALELLASQRRTVNRRQRRVELRGEDVWPHHVFEVDGSLYDVSYMRRVWAGVDYAEVELAELRDDGRSGVEQTFRLDSDRATTAPTSSATGGGGGTPSGGGDASTWDALSDKPTVLTPPGFSAGNFPSAEQLASADIASALNHDPGLSGGIQTTVRASDAATDDALATEQAIREAVNAVGAESLSDLSDVTLDSGTLYQDGYVLQGDGSGAYNDVPINKVLDSGNLGSLGSVSTANRSDGDVLQWVDGNLQYEHIAPADLISGSVGLDDLTDVTLNDTTKYEAQDVLAGNGNGEFVDKTIDTVLGEAEVQDLGNIANPGTDGNVIADQGGTYGAEAITSVTSGHVDWTDLQNVNHSNLKQPQVGFYDSNNAEWINGFIADLIRERGALSVGDVSFAASWRTIESPTEPTQRPDGSPLQEGDVWIDTDATPVAEAYVFRNGAFQKTASAIGGNNIVTDSIDATKITADTITANEIKADTITAKEIFADTITATEIKADTITATEIFSDTITATEIAADAITGALISATTSITVGNSLPNIKIDGSVDPSRIESTNFASLTEGFRIQSNGFAEFGDIRARGAIRSAVFERDEQVLRGGTDIVTPSTTLAQDAAAGDTTIEVTDVPFSAGDDIRFKESGTTEIRTISSISGTTLTLSSGLASGKTSGAAIARWNAERIVHSSDSQFAPFTSYINANDEEFARIGNLNGVSGLSGFGLNLGNESLVFDAEQDALRFQDAEAGPFQISKEAIEDGTLFVDSSEQAIYFDSDIHPDLQLGFGDFDRASLPDATNLASNYLSDPTFSNDLASWSDRAERKIGTYSESGPVPPSVGVPTSEDPDFYVSTREFSSGSADIDTDGDGTLDVTKSIGTQADSNNSAIALSSTLSAGNSVEGNKVRFDTPRVNGVLFGSSGPGVINPSTGSVTFFSETGNNPSQGLRMEITAANNFGSATSKSISQDVSLSGLAGNEITMEVPVEFGVNDARFSASLIVTKQSDGSVVEEKSIDAIYNPDGGLPQQSLLTKMNFTVPSSTVDLRLTVAAPTLKAIDGSLDSNQEINQTVRVDLKEIRLKDSLFNSVVAADGMLWRDQFNNDQMRFDVNTGEMKVRNFVGVGFNGAGIQVNSNGELEAVDESGNTTVIS